MKTLGVFELTGCGGCALNIVFLYSKLFDIVSIYEIREFHMVSSYREDGPVDIALVSGSVSTQRDLDMLKYAREHSRFLMAIGTCATHGNMQSSVEGDIKKKLESIGIEDNYMNALNSKPIVEYVKVDFALPGCPYDKDELYQALMLLAKGVEPVYKDYPVCVECKLNEYECVLVKRGIPCLGPLTVGGCNAICLRSGVGCIGCRGPLPKGANPASEARILRELGYDDEYIHKKFKTFGGGELKW